MHCHWQHRDWVEETLDMGFSVLPGTRNPTEVSSQMAENREELSNTVVKGFNNCYSMFSSKDKLWLSKQWHTDDIWLLNVFSYSFVWYLKYLQADISDIFGNIWNIIGMQGTNLRAWMFVWGKENLKESIIIWTLFSRSECKIQFNYLFGQSQYYVKLLVCLWRLQPISHFFHVLCIGLDIFVSLFYFFFIFF